MKSKSCQVYDQYKKVRNTVRSTTRNLLKEEQNKIVKDCRSTPKKNWNYISSKTKQHNSIGDLIHVNDQGLKVKTRSDADKAKILNDHFSNVFNKNMAVLFFSNNFFLWSKNFECYC